MSVTGPERARKPQYFEDPGLDCLYQMILVLGEELAALREQVDAAAAIQSQGDAPTREAVAAFDLGAEYDAVRQAFVERLLEPLQDLMDREAAD